MLRNNFGVQDATVLAQLEFVATAGRILQVHLRAQDTDLNIRSLHQHVFGDVYAWAGEPRIVELRKGDSSFGLCARIPHALEALHVEIGRLADEGREIDDGTLSYRLARIYADYNQTHPFREGNGRTGTLLLHLLADRAGRRLRLDGMSRSEWVSASRDSMPFRRDGRADPRPFLAVLRGGGGHRGYWTPMSDDLPPYGLAISADEADQLWDPWTPAEVARRLAGVDAPWCVAAGWAIDLYLGDPPRPHADIEIAVPRRDFPQIASALDGFDWDVAGGGRLWPLLRRVRSPRPAPNLVPRPDHRAVSPRCLPRAAQRGSMAVPARSVDHVALPGTDRLPTPNPLPGPGSRAAVQGAPHRSQRRAGLPPRSTTTDEYGANTAPELADPALPRPPLVGAITDLGIRIRQVALHGRPHPGDQALETGRRQRC